eukprot:2704854-Amphidinium_carterae.1
MPGQHHYPSLLWHWKHHFLASGPPMTRLSAWQSAHLVVNQISSPLWALGPAHSKKPAGTKIRSPLYTKPRPAFCMLLHTQSQLSWPTALGLDSLWGTMQKPLRVICAIDMGCDT